MKKTVTLYLFTIVIAIPAGIIHLITLLFGFWSHIWFPFVGWTGVQIILAVLFISDFYEEFRYFCPNCECFFKAWDIKEYTDYKDGFYHVPYIGYVHESMVNKKLKLTDALVTN